MCQRISKRLMVLILVLCFTFVQVTTPPQRVQAMGADIVIGVGATIATETAIAWLLGVLGFTAASVIIYENRDALLQWGGEMIDSFGEFCTDAYEQFQITASDAKVWLEQVAKGTIDKTSSAFSAFKAWALSMSKSSSTDITEIVQVNYDITKAQVIRAKQTNTVNGSLVWNNNGKYFEGYSNIAKSNSLIRACSVPVTGVQVLGTISNDATYKYWYGRFEYACALQDFTFHTYSYGYSGYVINNPMISTPYSVQVGQHIVYITDAVFANNGWINTDKGIYALRTGLEGDWVSVNVGYYNSIADATIKYCAMAYLDYMGLLEDGFFVSGDAEIVANNYTQNVIDRDGNLDNVDIIAPSGVASNVIEISWDKVGTLAPDGIYTLPFDNTGAVVTSKPLVIPVDTTTDTTLDTDIPIDDAISVPDTPVDTTEIDDYTIRGLESIFPFCLPFDFINFLNVLSAEPETPRFEWEMTFLEDLGFEPYTFVIDLAPFDTVATVCRNLELLAFILGLIIATRSKFIRS